MDIFDHTFKIRVVNVPKVIEVPRCGIKSLDVCFHILSQVKVTEWPPIGKIAAHSVYDMFHGIST